MATKKTTGAKAPKTTEKQVEQTTPAAAESKGNAVSYPLHFCKN